MALAGLVLALPALVAEARDGRAVYVEKCSTCHGKSGKPRDPLAYEELGMDLIRLLDHLAIERSHVVGYSLGGIIVAKLLTSHPERFLSAVLGGAAYRRSRSEASDLAAEAAAREIEDRGVYRALVVSTAPTDEPPPHALVLSFVPPAAEADLEARCAGRFISGRDLVDEVRPRGRSEYLWLIARIGSEPSLGGRTLRQILRGSGGFSRWWFLDVTEKDCLWDDDTLFLTVLQLMAVQELTERHRPVRLRLYGAAPAFAAALGQRFHCHLVALAFNDHDRGHDGLLRKRWRLTSSR